MSETNVNSDLLKCENDFFTKENQTKSLLITKNAKKSSIVSKNEIKTEKIESSVLNRAKDFLDKTKTDVNIGENCDLVDDNNSCSEQTDETDGKPLIEMNLMLFKDKQQSDNELSEEETDSETDESSADDSEREGSDSEDDVSEVKVIKKTNKRNA